MDLLLLLVCYYCFFNICLYYVEGQLRGCIRTAGRDAGQRVPLGHRGEHTQGDDQAAQHTAHCCQQRHR
jgi:hypothetical protein